MEGATDERILNKDNRSKEFWKEKRKRRKQKKRNESKSRPSVHWREGKSEEEIALHKDKIRRVYQWKTLPLEEIPFVLPRVVIELGFTEYMKSKELRSVISQLSFTYGYLKRAKQPLELHLCSFNGNIKNLLCNLQGFSSWKVHLHEESCQSVFGGQLAYLSPDAPDELHQLDENVVYVIGGIVDHNRLKVCWKLDLKVWKESNFENRVSHLTMPLNWRFQVIPYLFYPLLAINQPTH